MTLGVVFISYLAIELVAFCNPTSPQKLSYNRSIYNPKILDHDHPEPTL